MVNLKDIIGVLESVAPPELQEDYDNSGLQVSHTDQDILGILITLDVTEAVMDEAVRKKCNLVLAHHPILFHGLKRIDETTDAGRALRKAILHSIHIYAIHTNLDNVKAGVNGRIAGRLGLADTRVLLPKENVFSKLVTFCPPEIVRPLLDALHGAGAGIIGNYDHCSFRVPGTGSFRPNDQARPFTGETGRLEETREERIEVQFPSWQEEQILEALLETHPYEEVAYYIQRVDHASSRIGSGIIGKLEKPLASGKFLSFIKEKLELNRIRFTPVIEEKMIDQVACCGGSGSFLIDRAISEGADAFITADVKYHEFFRAEGRMMLADIGHYESEKFTKDLLLDLLNKKFSNIALLLSEINTNPVRYL